MTLVHRARVRRLVTRWATRVLVLIRRWSGRRLAGPPIGPTLDRMAELRLGSRSALIAAGSALVNWLAGLGCLCAALAAVGADIPWQAIILVWAAGAGVSSLGLTPGGLGVVEAAVGGALIAAGVPAAPAVAAVLIYRSVSLWLNVITGAVLLTVVRARIPGDSAA